MPASDARAQPADRKRPALRAGDRAVVVAPCSPFPPAKFERGVQALQGLGLEPAFGEGLFSGYPANLPYLAGDDVRRLAELRVALRDPAARLLVLARGGYGLLRLLDGSLPEGPLAVQEVRESGRLLLGYSDATVLHELWARAGVPSLHGPMCTQLGEEQSATERLRALLFGQQPGPISWQPLEPPGARHGTVEGVLRGGNLAVLSSMVGTPLQPQFRGCIVLLEDLNEPPYRLDRLVTQLLLSGAFAGALGFVIGDLVGPGEPSLGRAEAVAERLSTLNVPIAFGAPFGHAGRNEPVAFGCGHRLDAGAGQLTPLEAPTEGAAVA
jgi:muramoyltetrapeptide carboxypeptidase